MTNRITIQEISAPGCAHCQAARKTLENEIRKQFPNVEMQFGDMFSEEGQKLVQRYGILASPGIIVNGELFSAGGLDKKKLVEKIKSLLNK